MRMEGGLQEGAGRGGAASERGAGMPTAGPAALSPCASQSQPMFSRRCASVAQLTAQAHGESVGLLLEKRVALLGAHQLDLHDLQVLPRREDIEPSSARRHAAPPTERAL